MAKKLKYQPYTSAWDGVNAAQFTSPFASGRSYINGNTFATEATLNPSLQDAANIAQSGLSPNLQFLQQDPNQRVSFLTSGQDPYYNLLSETLRRNEADALGRSAVDAQAYGGLNSTAYGSAIGSILNDSILRKNSTMLDALNFGDQRARDNIDTNFGVINNLSDLANPLASAANSNVTTALGSRDNVGIFNAGNQFQADTFNTQQSIAQEQAAQARKRSTLGNLLNVGTSLLGGGLLGGLSGLTRRRSSPPVLTSSLISGGIGGGYLGGFN